MDPQQAASLNPIGLLATLAMGIVVLKMPRRSAVLPIILMTCYMTLGQKIVIFGLNFTMLRLLVLFCCIRIFSRGEHRSFKWLKIDKFVLLWVTSGVIAYTLLWQTPEALINRLGLAYDAVGFYFVFRCLIRDSDDIVRIWRMAALAFAPLALCMFAEKLSGRNPFFIFGGVPLMTAIREGVLRCQGPFQHPILAGTFGAVWMPTFVGLWWQGKRERPIAAIGILSCTAITFLSGSSGPVGSYMAGILACAMWRMRGHMREVRWAILGLVILLHMVMKAPVWFIFARVDVFSGSTGWHRSNLIDRTIANFSDWFLIGTKDTLKWGVWAADITNQYILEGVRGGLITMILFIGIIVMAFSLAGKARKAAKRESSRQEELLMWTLGATLFAHVISFMGISYFDQNIVNWYLLLAMVAAMHIYFRNKAHTAVEPPATVARRGVPASHEQASPLAGQLT